MDACYWNRHGLFGHPTFCMDGLSRPCTRYIGISNFHFRMEPVCPAYTANCHCVRCHKKYESDTELFVYYFTVTASTLRQSSPGIQHRVLRAALSQIRLALAAADLSSDHIAV